MIPSTGYTIETKKWLLFLTEGGGEMRRAYNKTLQKDILWEGDSVYWNRSAPVLFPIVGRLVSDQYIHNQKVYSMKQHGFARDAKHILKEKTKESISFSFESNYETHLHFPFDFILDTKYSIKDDTVITQYTVVNTGKQSMPFSIGGHPAFIYPYPITGQYCQIHFKSPKVIQPISLANGFHYIKSPCIRIDTIQVSETLFAEDAMIFSPPPSENIYLIDTLGNKLIFKCKNFPYLAFWKKENAPFICIEPWHGISDPVGFGGNLEDKPGILFLPSQEKFSCEFSFRVE